MTESNDKSSAIPEVGLSESAEQPNSGGVDQETSAVDQTDVKLDTEATGESASSESTETVTATVADGPVESAVQEDASTDKPAEIAPQTAEAASDEPAAGATSDEPEIRDQRVLVNPATGEMQNIRVKVLKGGRRRV